MKLYRYTVGVTEAYGVAEDEKDAYTRRAEVDHTFSFLPVTIEEIIVPGYDIIVTPLTQNLEGMDREALKRWLTEKQIEFTPQWGEAKLRELALQHV